MSSDQIWSGEYDQYEVFLSFRGPDTRQGFTDCLYHALVNARIQVFKDDDELRPGDRIDRILKAIDDSQICIPIFSKTFADSTWCLREIERMVEMEKDIVPVFYDVTPNEVKLHTGLYPNALMLHEIKYEKQQVQKWRKALQAIPKFKGWELKDKGFAGFIEQLVTDISLRLSTKEEYYDVFLSFRGPDTRQSFTNCLYHAMKDARIKVFMDVDGTQTGIEFGVAAYQALDKSKICVAVISESFGYSTLCLGEVQRMVMMEKHIVPIYYGLESYDVRLRSHLYADALTTEQRHGKEQVEKWIEALERVTNLRGHVLRNSGFVEFSRKVTEEVLAKLKEIRRNTQ